MFRALMIALSAIAAIYLAHGFYVYYRTDLWPIAALLCGTLLNLAYLLTHKDQSARVSQPFRLFRLWLDAKEAELQARAKGSSGARDH